MEEFSPTSQENIQQKPRGSKMTLLLLACFLLVLAAGGFWAYTQFFAGSNGSGLQQQVQNRDQANNLGELIDADTSQTVPTSLSGTTFDAVSEAGPQSYPFVRGSKLLWLPLDGQPATTQKDLTLTGYRGWLGYGEGPLLMAPDLRKAAVITEDGLQIISSDGSVVKPQPDLPVAYLSGWSSDSKKLVVYVSAPTAKSILFEQGPGSESPWSTTTTVRDQFTHNGFYMLDLTERRVKPLHVMEDALFETWVNSDTIMFYLEEGNDDRFYAFYNTSTGVLDPVGLGYAFKDYFTPSFDFDKTGQKWLAFLAPDNFSETGVPSKLAIGPVKQVPTTTVIEGKFASFQMGMLSPDGARAIFETKDEPNGVSYVHLWEGSAHRRLFEGRPITWIDDTKFLYGIYTPLESIDVALKQVKVYDVTAGQSRDLAQF